MDGGKFNIAGTRPRILVAPLDWGLGHATRCIPIIFKLLKENCEVIIAAELGGKTVLQKEFPSLSFLDLEGYRITYASAPGAMPLKMLAQFPKILSGIKAEHRWLSQMVETHKIDAVISDNRMGLYHASIPCIYITHQLKIITGNSFTDMIAQKIHYRFINKFSACWVPDLAGGHNLAGVLSHPAVLPKTAVSYIGPLTRFTEQQVEAVFDAGIILSGPEPQRTIFEKIILQQIGSFNGNVCLVRGLPGNSIPLAVPPNVTVADHLPSAELNDIILRSKVVICRSGYSSVMDLVRLKKKAVLVPTPGQTEQEYLGKYLNSKKMFYTVKQDGFDLQRAVDAVSVQAFTDTLAWQDDYHKIVEAFVGRIKLNNTNT